jgi:hypothetical protein
MKREVYKKPKRRKKRTRFLLLRFFIKPEDKCYSIKSQLLPGLPPKI